ncbi:MAG: CoA ester lyase [Betaproteobacteria bacterium]
MRPLRSLLIMPANREDMLLKAPSYGADALVFDLEDSVPVAEKPKARLLARQYIEKHHAQNALYVRVNAVQTGLIEEDLNAVVTEGLLGIRLTKAESADDIRHIDSLLTTLEKQRGLKEGSIGIGPSLESAKGVWFAYEILSASPRIFCVVAGTAQDGDLQKDLGYQWTAVGEEVLYIRSRILLAARAAGVELVIDGSYANIKDPEGLMACSQAARKLGYRGKSIIHPNQVAIVNRAFTPTRAEMDYYKKVLAVFDEAVARGSAATTLDGKLIDYAMAASARQVLSWGDAIAD